MLILFEKHWRQRETVAIYTMKINRSSLGNVQDSTVFNDFPQTLPAVYD